MINTVSRPQFSAGYTQKQIDEIKYLEALKKNNVDDILALFDLPKASSPLFKREQGFGDSIQFVRYLKLLKQKGATVLFECQPELISLFENLNYIDQLIPSGQANDINSDYISPLLSLPRVFNTDQSNISIMEPYLFPHKEKAALWQERLVAPAKINIGVVWAGSPTHRHDRYRSIPLKKLYHLFRFSHCRLFSFQKGPAEKQLEPFKNNMINLSPHIHDFSDTAAMLKAMDVVITVDTAVAHLAGALGIPTKLLLAYTPDWRWQLNRLDTPWYPSVKLYRQQSFNDWSEPVKKLIDDLKFINKLV